MYRNELENAWEIRKKERNQSYTMVKAILDKAEPNSLDYYNALTILGILEIYRSNYEVAEEALLNANAYYLDHDDLLYHVRNDNNLGIIYMISGDLSKAITILIHGLESLKKYHDHEMYIYLVYNLSEVYKDIRNFKKSIYYLKMAMNENRDNTHALTQVLYSSMAQCLGEVNQYDEAIEFANRSFQYVTSKKDKHTLSLHYITLGNLYRGIGQFDKALNYCDKSLQLRTEMGDQYSISVCYLVMAKISYAKCEYAKVIEYAEKSLKISTSVNSDVNNIIVYELLADAYKKQDLINEALFYYEKLIVQQENHFNKDLQNNISVISAENNIESLKKDAEIYRLNNMKLKQKSEEMKLISKIGQILITALDFKVVVEQLYSHIKELMDIQFMSIGILKDNSLEYPYIIFENSFLLPYHVINNNNSVGYKSIMTNQSIYISKHSEQNPKSEKIKEVDELSNIESMLFCPLYNHKNPIGVISIQSFNVNAFSQQDVDLLEGLSSYIAIAIDNALKTAIINDTANELRNTLDNLKKTQEELIQAEKLAAMGSLVAGVAHKLNTPIGTSITLITHQINTIRNLQSEFLNESLSRKNLSDCISKSLLTLQNIEEAIIQSSDMINSFKSLALTKSDLMLNTLTINQLHQIIFQTEENSLNQHDVTLKTNYTDANITTYTTIIIEIIHQLISNSIIHSFCIECSRVIELYIELIDNEIHIIYKDKGKKIPLEIQENMYEPFYSTRKIDGMMGIGLHAVHNMVTHLLGGTIRYEQGFTIIIPNLKQEA